MNLPKNPFLVSLSPGQLLNMIEIMQDGIRKKTIPATTRGKKKFELMELQDTLKWQVEQVKTSEDVELWGKMIGLPVMILPLDEMGTITGPKDGLTVNVEWGTSGQENDYYPMELDTRIPSYIWQIP